MQETFVRPNGKVYRPRRTTLETVGFANEDRHWEVHYVAVLRTHDIERARAWAVTGYVCEYIIDPKLAWIRKTIRDGQFVYVDDDVRGVPAVVFTESDDPREEGEK